MTYASHQTSYSFMEIAERNKMKAKKNISASTPFFNTLSFDFSMPTEFEKLIILEWDS